MALNSSKEPRQTKRGLLRFQNLGSTWAVLSLPVSDRNQTPCRRRFGPPEALEKFVVDRREFVNKGVLAALAGGAGSTASTARANEPGTNPTRKSVKEFGAIGDGRTDDSAAIEKALASNTGTLVFERGIYKLGRTIVIDLSKRGWTSIDGTGGAPLENQTVVIRNGRIANIGLSGRVQLSADAEVVDGSGHTLIPGLIGLLNHSYYTAAGGRAAQLSTTGPIMYLASGVTTIRTTGARAPYEELNLKEIGQVLGVVESRVSQIRSKAILKLRAKLRGVILSKDGD